MAGWLVGWVSARARTVGRLGLYIVLYHRAFSPFRSSSPLLPLSLFFSLPLFHSSSLPLFAPLPSLLLFPLSRLSSLLPLLSSLRSSPSLSLPPQQLSSAQPAHKARSALGESEKARKAKKWCLTLSTLCTYLPNSASPLSPARCPEIQSLQCLKVKYIVYLSSQFGFASRPALGDTELPVSQS
jgi:hypothetical protein